MAQRSFISSFVRSSTTDDGVESVQNSLENTFRSIQPLLEEVEKKVVPCPLLDGHLLEDVSIEYGDNEIAHKLGREIRGWFITRVKGAPHYGGIGNSNIVTLRLYENNAGTESMSELLYLHSNAIAVLDLWVF